MGDAELGQRLRGAGLTARALAAWAGTERVSALPARLPALGAREPVPAAAALALFVGGAELASERARALPVEALLAAGLVERVGDRVRARVAILPVGPSLAVCDRADAPATAELVCWPDDSSYHLAAALPARRVEHWLDLGCGSAFAALARPQLAARITGVELNPRAVGYARLGAALSGVAHLTIVAGDVAHAAPPAALVTCNAPMPQAGDVLWKHAGGGFFARLVEAIPARLAPGGLAVIHADLAAIPLAALAGERVVVAYTPDEADPAFGVLWWRPDAPARVVRGHRPLTPARPHLDASDRDPRDRDPRDRDNAAG